MLGAVIGDIAGSRFERNNHKSKEFELLSLLDGCRLTDDSVMTLAVAKAILSCNGDYAELGKRTASSMRSFGKAYPRAGYGERFQRWIVSEDPQPYHSYGNGAAMRVSACGYAADSLEEAVQLARLVTEVTHDHPEAIKAAEAVATAIYLAINGKTMQEIRSFIEEKYYLIDFTLDSIRPDYCFDDSCQGSVPQAFEAFFEAVSFEDAIRNAISIGGDSDTIAAITGSIAEAYFGIPGGLRRHANVFLNDEFREIINRFEERFGLSTVIQNRERIKAAEYEFEKKNGVKRVGRHLPGQTDFDLRQYPYFADYIYSAPLESRTEQLKGRLNMGYIPPVLFPENIRSVGHISTDQREETLTLVELISLEMEPYKFDGREAECLFSIFQALDNAIIQEQKTMFLRRNTACLRECDEFYRHLFRYFFPSGLPENPDVNTGSIYEPEESFCDEQKIRKLLFDPVDGIHQAFHRGAFYKLGKYTAQKDLIEYAVHVYHSSVKSIADPPEIGTMLLVFMMLHELITTNKSLIFRLFYRDKIADFLSYLYLSVLKGYGEVIC